MNHNKRYISKLTSAAFILPAILVVGLLLLYPVATSIFYSFTSKHLIKPKWDFAFNEYEVQNLIAYLVVSVALRVFEGNF